jgi:hypothetical protein
LARPQAAAKQDRPEPPANWSLLGAGLESIGVLLGAGLEPVGRLASVASPSVVCLSLLLLVGLRIREYPYVGERSEPEELLKLWFW